MTMVVLVLVLIWTLQTAIAYSATYGRLDAVSATLAEQPWTGAWIALRAAVILAAIVLWVLNRRRNLFRVIIVANALLTLGLAGNTMALMQDLVKGFSTQALDLLLSDVFFVAVTNILVFSIWYWIVDPPGIEEGQRDEDPWELLFPQRADNLPGYEDWQPRYTDYLFVAFTTSFAFSPTDTMPLTRRAKLLMLLQSSISIVTLTGLAGGAINLLGGSS